MTEQKILSPFINGELKWVIVYTDPFKIYRLRLAGGWLLLVDGHSERTMTFVPDLEKEINNL